jgi:NAD(P)-dependent dehydrogenase (short-subunit alcohol dehydrogenase family)
MPDLTFEGRVAIVTGAGSGIGRAVALCLARRGARLLVNDIGEDLDPSGRTAKRAQRVADEIALAGGVAVASQVPIGTHDAARAIVADAVRSFGRIDMLVNSAGVSLTGSITDHADEALNQVIEVDLLGAYAMVRAVWPVMERQRSGSILSMSSNAALGIGMNAPYAIAKAGLLGLTLDAAQEGAACGIRVNAFMPLAYTRMAEGIPDAQFLDWLRTNFPPTIVAEAAACFLHPQCDTSGRIFSIGGGYIASIAFLKGQGFVAAGLTAEAVRDNLAQIVGLQDGTPLVVQSDEMKDYFKAFPWTGRAGMDHLDLKGVG